MTEITNGNKCLQPEQLFKQRRFYEVAIKSETASVLNNT